MDQTNFFDAEAARWNDRYSNDSRFARRFEKISSLFDRVLPMAPGHALDAGCGAGIFSWELVRRGWRVTAIDNSPQMIAAARAAGPNDVIEFLAQPYQTYQADFDSFDVILSLSMIEYEENDEAVIQKFSEMLKPGGLLIISVPNRKGLLRVFEGVIFGIRTLTRGRWFGERGEYLQYQKRQYAPLELNIMMRQVGLRKVRGMFLGAGSLVARPLLPVFERRWWATMYCAAYKKS